MNRIRIKKRFWIISSVLIIAMAGTLFFMDRAFSGNQPNDKDSSNIEENGIHKRVVKLPEIEIDKEDSRDGNAGIVEMVDVKGLKLSPDVLPSKYRLSYDIIVNNAITKQFERSYDICFPGSDDYSGVPGITCFRGNNYRNAASYGYADIKYGKLTKIWSAKTGYIDTWTGVGWTGQPAIVKWGDNVREIMNLYPDKKKKTGLKEVIYATLDGKIYFIDLDDGKPTRPFINTGHPHKGTVSVDPRGYPLLFAGQGVVSKNTKKYEFGYRIFSLIDNKLLYFINGLDRYAFRKWGAFDSSGLLDAKTDTYIECGENGILYTLKLNTNFDAGRGRISINPGMIRYRYRSPKNSTIGMENSPAIYRNLIYFTDNSGTLQCIDLKTLSPVWIRDVTDDTDSSIAIEEEGNSQVSLYTACEIDIQGQKGLQGLCYIRKINALTGSLIWEKSYRCIYNSYTNGGALASPVVGKHDISNLIVYNIAKTENNNSGKLAAFEKKTGKEVWTLDFNNYSWSSPVDIYTKDGKSYLIFCDSAGNMFLIEGKNGRIVDKISLGANVEASPAVYDDMIVVGTRGQQIWGIRVY